MASTTLLGVAAPLEFTAQQRTLLDPRPGWPACAAEAKAPRCATSWRWSRPSSRRSKRRPFGFFDGLGKVDFPISTCRILMRSAISTRDWALPTASITPRRSPRSARPSGSIPAARCAGGRGAGPWAQHHRADYARRQRAGAEGSRQGAATVRRRHAARTGADHGLAQRYSADENAKRAELDGAYADAMLMVARYYPQHDDISLSRPRRRWTRCHGIIGMRENAIPSRGSVRRSTWSRRSWPATRPIRRRRTSTST